MVQDLFNYYKNALSNGLCNEYKDRWRACHNDKEKLFNLVMAQQSLPHFIYYCYNGIGVSKDFILKNFGGYINGNKITHDADGVQGYTYSMYVDYNAVFKANTDVLALLWCSCPQVTIYATKSPILYVGAGSTVHVSLEGYNNPMIYLFDDSNVLLDDADEESKVIVYRYSPNANVEIGKYFLADVKVFDKKLRL